MTVVTGRRSTYDKRPFVAAGPADACAAGAAAVRTALASRAARVVVVECYPGVRAADVLPLLLGAADRPAFLGTRPGRTRSWGLPDRPEALTVPPDPEESPDGKR